MTQQQQEMRAKAVGYSEEIRALGVTIPDIPPDYEITWGDLGNLCLILMGQRFLSDVKRIDASRHKA